MADLTGTWKYTEEYTRGNANGELYLRQEGDKLSGRVVFADHLKGEEPYMIQEFMEGTIEGRKVKLKATGYDVIHAEMEVDYDLDEWVGLVLNEGTIKGVSADKQGVDGNFVLVKVISPLPDGF